MIFFPHFSLFCTTIPFALRVLVCMHKNIQISALSKMFLANSSQDQRPNPVKTFLTASRSCLFHVSFKLGSVHIPLPAHCWCTAQGGTFAMHGPCHTVNQQITWLLLPFLLISKFCLLSLQFTMGKFD